jgi:hypothetical protein
VALRWRATPAASVLFASQITFLMGPPQLSKGEVVEFRSWAFGRHHTPTAVHPPVLVRHALTLLAKLPGTFGFPDMLQPYPGPPRNPYDRLLRSVGGKGLDAPDALVTSHFASRHAAEEQARIKAVPCEPGADWRDICNAEAVRGLRVMIETNSCAEFVLACVGPPYCILLVLRLFQIKVDVPGGGFKWIQPMVYVGPAVDAIDQGIQAPRAVHECMLPREDKRYKPCVGSQRAPAGKGDCLIPWSLPHSAARHNQWDGLYGRQNPWGYSPTIVTHATPIGKQGRWLHPTELRIITAREAARMQGFADDFEFTGQPVTRYKQIGNAVPPPLAYALAAALLPAFVSPVQCSSGASS